MNPVKFESRYSILYSQMLFAEKKAYNSGALRMPGILLAFSKSTISQVIDGSICASAFIIALAALR